MLLTLLALALPTAALANIISTGTFINSIHSLVSRNASGGFSVGNFSVQIQGTANTIHILTGPLHGSPPGLSTGCTPGTNPTGTCTFDDGSVIINPGTPGAITLPVEDGVVTRTTTTATITAILEPNSTVSGRGVVFDIDFLTTTPPALNRIQSGTALVGTPEPGTLCLLGTSVIGLAGLARRRLKLGR